MQTLVEQRAQLTTLINGGLQTVGTTHTALANHTDRLVQITGGIDPGARRCWRRPRIIGAGFTKLNGLSKKFFDEGWMPELDTATCG